MTKVIVTIDEKDLTFEFSETWQIEWLIKFLNWYLCLPEKGLARRIIELLASWLD